MAASLKILLFCGMTPCSMVEVFRTFIGMYCIYRHSEQLYRVQEIFFLFLNLDDFVVVPVLCVTSKNV